MPPLWLIVGATGIVIVVFLGDRVILKPRARAVVVDDKEILVRKTRDNHLLVVAMSAMFIALSALAGVIEASYFLFAGGAVVFGGVMVLSIVRAVKSSDRLPTADELRAAKPLSRRVIPILALVVLGIVLDAVSSATGGAASAVLVTMEWVSRLVLLWLMWRWFREYRRLRKAGHVR